MKAKLKRSRLMEYKQSGLDKTLMVSELEESRQWRETQAIMFVHEAKIREDECLPAIAKKL